MDNTVKNITVKKEKSIIIEILQNPFVILCALVIGVLVGVFFPEFSKNTEVVGRLYFYLLEMSVIPILMTAIISALAKIITMPDFTKFLRKIIITMVIYWLVISVIGNIGAYLFQVGVIEDANALSGIIDVNSKQTDTLEISLKDNTTIEKNTIIKNLLISIIPRNIFRSLATANTLALVFFSIMVGIALGIINKQKSGEYLLTFMEDAFEVFKTIISWILCLLPFALISLISYQIASTGLDILAVMLKFILMFYIIVIIIVTFNTILIWRRSSTSLITVIKALVEPSVVALVTRNSFASLSASMDSLSKKLSFQKNIINLVTPLGTALGRYGNILFFAYIAQFSLQLYGVELTISKLILCIILAVMSGIASTGATGIATLSIISIILSPLGIPTEAILIILIVVDPIIDPMRSLLIVHANLAVSSVVASVDLEKLENEKKNTH